MDNFIMRREGVHRLVRLSEMKELFGMDDKFLESLFTKQFKYEYQHKLKHDKCNVKNFRDCNVCKIFELLAEDAKHVLSSEMISSTAKQLSANRKHQGQCGSPTVERDLTEQVENINCAFKTQDLRAVPASLDQNTLQADTAEQENSTQVLQNENKRLHQRIRQNEHLLEDCMRKVDDALVLEYKLRDEVLMLKNRVCDLEARHAALKASATKERDEGYCTMSLSQIQLPLNYLEPEQWLDSTDPCFTETEDWSMSHKEFKTTFEEDSIGDNWLSNSTHFLNSACDSQSEEITTLLQDQIDYPDDKDLICKDFIPDFYRLSNIPESGTKRLKSQQEPQFDSSLLCSSTSSEVEQITSCSSNHSGQNLQSIDENISLHYDIINCGIRRRHSFLEKNACNFKCKLNKSNVDSINCTSWRCNNGWRNEHQPKPPSPTI